MILTLAAFVQLAASCGPSVHVDTLAAIGRTESGFQTDAIHDNTDGRSYSARSRAEATAIATNLVTAQRHSVDLGLMQVNNANLPALGMSIEDAFDPCRSIAAGARLLSDGFRPPAAGTDAQPALLEAISRYNTGHPRRGFANGYVARVLASAKQVVPAISLDAPDTGAREGGKGSPSPPSIVIPATSPPPAWDVFAQARQARRRSAFVLAPATRDPAPTAAAPVARPGNPIRLQAHQMGSAG